MTRVLIVEDEAILALMTKINLEDFGYEVVGIADTGNEAIEIANKETPDFILMDIVLKGSLNGIETSKIISDKYDCKIIYMTAHSDAVTVEAAKSTKPAGFLNKPINWVQLKGIISGTIRH